MAQPKFVEGQRAKGPSGDIIVFSKGRWYPEGKAPSAKALSPGEASQRGRLTIGLAPLVEAERTMSAMEAKGNPVNNDWGAYLLDSLAFGKPGQRSHPLRPLAKYVGGQDYQDYTQASQAFESQLMPIMSGAAVSPSEAERQIRASLPQLGDSGKTLGRKSMTRRMMVNGGARVGGAQIPFPDTATYGLTGPGATLDPALARRMDTARQAWLQSWVQRRGTLEGAEPHLQRFMQSRFGAAAEAKAADDGWSIVQ